MNFNGIETMTHLLMAIAGMKERSKKEYFIKVIRVSRFNVIVDVYEATYDTRELLGRVTVEH